MSEQKGNKTSMGLEENVAGLLCYVLTWVTGIVFFILEKDNKFVRFHAMQSIITFLPLTILAGIFGVVLWWFGWIINVLIIVLWLVLMLKAYQGTMFKLPLVGDIAEKQVK